MAQSWREKDEQIMLSITCGDGETYFPEYIAPSYSIGMSTVAIEPNNLAGALVVSGKISFRKFDMRLVFQGDDHIDQTEKFAKSSEDVRPWIVFHPYYGRIVGRPSGEIKVDNQKLNVSDISITFWESLLSKVRDTQISYTQIEVPLRPNIAKIEKVDKLSKWQKIIGAVAKAKATTDEALSDITRAINRADRFINTIGTDAQRYMAQVGYIARSLGMLFDTAINRIESEKASYYDMKNAFTGLGSTNDDVESLLKALSIQDKQSFETAGSYSVQSTILAATISKKQAGLNIGIRNPEDEPAQTVDMIERQIQEIAGLYSDYIETIGMMQSAKDCKLDSYYPNYETVKALENNVLVALNGLYEKIVGATVNYEYIVPQSIALIPLVFKLVGNCDQDTVMAFAERNHLSMDEIFVVPAGRAVTYAR